MPRSSGTGTPVSVVRPLLRVMAAIVLLTELSTTTAWAQDLSPLARVEALRLDTARVGRVTAHFAPADRDYASQLAALSEDAASYFERELSASFPLRLAVLSPRDWFDPYPGGDAMPYGMPWGWVEELLITAPASLDEGVLFFGPDEEANWRRVRFVLLHEFGHLASKQHLHPGSSRPYSSVRWFEELLATYFGYAYVRAHDPKWAEASRREWVEVVGSYTPPVLSLDWSFMRDLPPDEIAQTYAWYQNLLNLRVADLYEEHGLDFLRAVSASLAWEDSGKWTTESLLPALEEIAPGFEAWATDLRSGDYLRRAEATLGNAGAEFWAAKELKDRLYAERDDCPGLMNMFSEDVVFWEKGRRMSYDFLVEYCPQLPKSIWEPEESSSVRVVLSRDAAYEILTEKLIHPEDGAIYMRTTTEIWQKLEDAWKITHINIGLHQVN